MSELFDHVETQDPDDGPRQCPECGKPNQFGELCLACVRGEQEDLEYRSELQADRVSAAWKNGADRKPADLSWTPLFQGEAVEAGKKTVERQKGLFEL